MPLSELPSKGIAAHSGHIDVSDQHIRPEQAAHVQRLVAAESHDRFVSLVAQYHAQHVCIVAVVIRNQDTKRLRRRTAATGGNYAKGSFRTH